MSGAGDARAAGTPPVLASACLLGRACRWDGRACPDARLVALAERGGAVGVCPEELGGLPTPREPCEQVRGAGGAVRVLSKGGADRTAEFLRGAELSVEAAREAGAVTAVLRSCSPSCGVGLVYDGDFCGTLVPGDGLAARALRAAGLEVWTEESWPGSAE